MSAIAHELLWSGTTIPNAEPAQWSVINLPDLPILFRMQRFEVAAGRFDLWCCHVEDVPASMLRDPQKIGVLSAGDLDRYRSLKSDTLRHLFVTSRLLLRHVLAHETSVPAARVAFVHNRFGRPQLAPDLDALTGPARLRFSLSHSGSLAILAVTRSGEIGADLEQLSRRFNVTDLAGSVLTAEERRELSDLAGPEKRSTFLKYWVLKEAFTKACGVGLTMDVSRLTFGQARHGRIQIQMEQRVLDRWVFRALSLAGDYVAAIAFTAGSNPGLPRMAELEI